MYELCIKKVSLDFLQYENLELGTLTEIWLMGSGASVVFCEMEQISDSKSGFSVDLFPFIFFCCQQACAMCFLSLFSFCGQRIVLVLAFMYGLVKGSTMAECYVTIPL